MGDTRDCDPYQFDLLKIQVDVVPFNLFPYDLKDIECGILFVQPKGVLRDYEH